VLPHQKYYSLPQKHYFNFSFTNSSKCRICSLRKPLNKFDGKFNHGGMFLAVIVLFKKRIKNTAFLEYINQ